MIEIRYMRYLLIAAVACGLAALCMWLLGKPLGLEESVLSFLLGAVVTSFVTVRLPVFRHYYNATTQQESRKHRGVANEQAAPVMASLVAGSVIGMLLYAFGVQNVVGPAFIGAVCAGVVSQYHRKKC